MGQAAAGVADGQRVVGDEALREYLAVTLAARSGSVKYSAKSVPTNCARSTPVTRITASFTSVILPSGLIVTSGSGLASITLREDCAAA